MGEQHCTFNFGGEMGDICQKPLGHGGAHLWEAEPGSEIKFGTVQPPLKAEESESGKLAAEASPLAKMVIAGAVVASLLGAVGAFFRWPIAMGIALILAIIVTVSRLRRSHD